MKTIRLSLALLLLPIAAAAQTVIGSGTGPGVLGNAAATGAAARAAAGLDNIVSTMDAANGTVYGDAQQALFPGMTWTTTSPTVITLAAGGTWTDTVTTIAGTHSLVFASTHCTTAMFGQPVSITGVGADGGVYNGVVSGCGTSARPSTTLEVNPPIGAQLTAQSVTVTYGPNFSTLDVGKTFCWSTVFAGATCSQITAVTSSTSITLTGSVGNGASGNQGPEKVWWGHCDDISIQTAVRRAIAQGNPPLGGGSGPPHPYLRVSANHLICGNGVDLSGIYRVDPIGLGNFYPSIDAGYAGSNSNLNAIMRPVLPLGAPLSEPPQPGLNGVAQFKQFGACRPNCIAAISGDSIWAPENNNISGLLSPYGQWMQKLGIDNGGQNLSLNIYSCGIGGAQWTNIDNNPNGTNGTCITSTGTAWLTQVQAINPDLLCFGMQNNGTVNNQLIPMIDVFAKIASWSKVPDTCIFTHHTYSLASAPGFGGKFGWEIDNAMAGMLRGYAKVNGIPLIDANRTATKERDGFDPENWQFVRDYTMPTTLNPGLFTWMNQSHGYSLDWTGATGGSTYWTTYGNQIGFSLGGFQAQQETFAWISRNSSTGAIGIQCDISTQNAYADYPGLACQNPATGKPPVTPTILAQFTIASGTPTTLTSNTALFTSADTGTTFTIPGAGATVSENAYGNYTLPLVTTVTYVSATQLTLTTAASNFFTSRSQVVERGNPVITPLVSLIDNGSTEAMEFAVQGDHLVAWWGNQYNIIYDGPVVRDNAQFMPMILTGSGSGTLTVATDPVNALPLIFTTQPILNARSYTDDEIQGSSQDAAPQAICGGDGTNHPACGFVMRTWDAVINAQSWRMAPDGTRSAWTITSAGSFATLPAGAALRAIYVTNTTGNAVTGGINIGTTANGSDVVAAAAVNANGLVTIGGATLLKTQFSASATQQLFVSAVGSFNSASLNIRVVFDR